MNTLKPESSRNLVLLGIILQSLHVLFGVTALIGIIITQTSRESVRGTVHYSQLQWQFVTFWLAIAGYTLGFYVWIEYDNSRAIIAVLMMIIYRLSVSIWHWRRNTAITRFL